MEQGSQVGSTASDVAAASAVAEQTSGDEVLREELAKWRERVPKLAAALRQRAEEAERLKQELERARRTAAPEQNASAGIRARDELIAELEGRLGDLTERHNTAQGELHRRQLEVEALKRDLEAWKGKWQSVTRTLDEQADAVSHGSRHNRELEQANESLRQQLGQQASAHDADRRALDEAVEERDSLRRRNEQLFETTELANRQIGSLTDSLAELRASLKQHRTREVDITAERQTLQDELGSLRSRLAEVEESARRQAGELESAGTTVQSARRQADELAERLRAAEQAGESAERTLVLLTEELHLVATAAAAGVRSSAEGDARVAAAERARQDAERRLAESEQARSGQQAALDQQCREVEHLTEVVEVAQRTTEEREKERWELSERLQALESRNGHLEQQLGERSALVVTLERDQSEAAKLRQTLEQQRDELEEALMRAERHVKENAEHVTALDDKLERQKELMERLEEELADAKDEQARLLKSQREAVAAADAATAADADAGGSQPEVARLQEQVRKLEGLVRERTEALNRLEWRSRISDAETSQTEVVGDPADRAAADAKMLLVLNQQLADARARNDELLARLRELEGASEASGPRNVGDDLTRIHGVGQKLAEQLNDLGIYRYEQIAEIDESELADESHLLHGHRNRILRDGWIDQAVKLISH